MVNHPMVLGTVYPDSEAKTSPTPTVTHECQMYGDNGCEKSQKSVGFIFQGRLNVCMPEQRL